MLQGIYQGDTQTNLDNILDFVWLLTAIFVIYFGYDVHDRLSKARKETTVSKSMIVVGALFFLLGAYHVYTDSLGASPPLVIHLVPIAVLVYAVYEYRRLLREASSTSSD